MVAFICKDGDAVFIIELDCNAVSRFLSGKMGVFGGGGESNWTSEAHQDNHDVSLL